MNTYSNGCYLRSSGFDGGIDWGSSIALGRTAAALGAEMYIDSEKILSELRSPMSDKWFTGSIPSRVEWVNASRIEATDVMGNWIKLRSKKRCIP